MKDGTLTDKQRLWRLVARGDWELRVAAANTAPTQGGQQQGTVRAAHLMTLRFHTLVESLRM